MFQTLIIDGEIAKPCFFDGESSPVWGPQFWETNMNFMQEPLKYPDNSVYPILDALQV